MAKNKPPVSKFLKVGGSGEGKLLLRSFLPPPKNIKSNQSNDALNSSFESGERYAGGISRTVLAPDTPSDERR